MATVSKLDSNKPDKIDAWQFYRTLERAISCNTTYVNGCFGASLDLPKNLTRYTKAGWNKEHAEQIKAAAAKGHCFGFDCVGLVKSCGWWGWIGDPKALYGGAVYKAHNMPDCSVHAIIRDYCKKGVNIDKKNMEIPFLALLYDLDWSHIAVSIGNGIAIEATRYGDVPGVRYTYIANAAHPLVKKIPTRHYDAYAICNYIDYSKIWKAVDANGILTVLQAIPDVKPPVQITKFAL